MCRRANRGRDCCEPSASVGSEPAAELWLTVQVFVAGSKVSVSTTLRPESNCERPSVYAGLISLVTPLATKTLPEARVTSVGYQRPKCMSLEPGRFFQVLALGSKMRVALSPC